MHIALVLHNIIKDSSSLFTEMKRFFGDLSTKRNVFIGKNDKLFVCLQPMRKHVAMYILLSVCLFSCGHDKQKAMESNMVKPVPTTDTLTTDSFRYESENEYGSCEVYIDYPVSGPSKTVQSVRDFISSLLFEHHTTGVPTQPDEMVRYYCEERLSHFNKVLTQMQVGNIGRDEAPEEGIEIRLADMGARWCTFEVYRYSYLTGGAHGEYTEYGVSFRLSDGHRLTGAELLRPVDDGLYSYIKRGMREYFDVDTDEQLQAICHVDLHLRPMPTHSPYLTRKGMRFHYSIYDVCPFEWGDPSFTIPYEEIKPYLTGTALELISND
jgi:hypothetical protein